MTSHAGFQSWENEDWQAVAAMANQFAADRPDFGAEEDSGLFMVRAAFDAYEGPMVTEKYLKFELVLDGHGKFYNQTELGAYEAQFRSGSLFAAPPGIAGETRSSPMNMLGFLIDLEEFAASRAPNAIDRSFAALPAKAIEDPVISSVMMSLWHSSRSSSRSSLFIREGVEVLLDRLAHQATGTRAEIELRHARDLQMRKARAFILGNLENDIGVDDVARAAGTTYHSFFAICRMATGMSPFSFLTYCRMHHARKLMRDGAPVLEAGLAVGYSNPSKFAAAFKRHFGLTPRQWKGL